MSRSELVNQPHFIAALPHSHLTHRLPTPTLPNTSEDDQHTRARHVTQPPPHLTISISPLTSCRSISEDRLITVLIGEGEWQQKFMLQDTLLRRTSRVFSAALNNEHLGEGDKGVLKFPEDDVAAWKVLVFWMFDKKLPEEDFSAELDEKLQLLLVECWVLGDKYEIPEFQDLVMLELLHHFNSKGITPETAKRAAAMTTSGSKLRILAGRQIAQYATGGTKMAIDTFDGALGVEGFASEVIELIRPGNTSGKTWVVTYIGQKDGKWRLQMWKDFMVGSGPGKHWIHNVHSDALEDKD